MNRMHYTFAALLVLVPLSPCFSIEDTNTIAISAWSQPVETSAVGQSGSCAISGRFLILEGRSSAYAGKLPETLVYLEFRNASSGAGGAIDFYFDPRDGLRAELLDKNSQPPPPVGTGGSGAFPGPCWITLPYDATVRLRCSWLGYGMAKTAGLKIPLFEELILRADNTNDYYLAVTFTAPPPTNHVVEPGHTVWQGTLVLPKVKVSGKRP